MKLRFLVLLIPIVIIFSSSVNAVSISDATLEYNERFIEDSRFLFSFKCDGGDYTGALINITKGDWWYAPYDFTETPIGENLTQVAYNIDPQGLDGTGNYILKATCQAAVPDHASVGFEIYSFEKISFFSSKF